ncbi:MAG: helix-hairpin-helix domain-containing protein [Comamonas sp.]|nr:helix-hairpin-helix domain-containing protein [Comamonas sp.]
MLKKFIAIAFALCTTIAWAAVDANKATSNELTTIKGIGTATADRIIDARKQASFKNWDDFILRVKGIAPTSAGKLSAAGLTINGQGFKPGATPIQTTGGEKSIKPVQPSGKKDNKG